MVLREKSRASSTTVGACSRFVNWGVVLDPPGVDTLVSNDSVDLLDDDADAVDDVADVIHAGDAIDADIELNIRIGIDIAAVGGVGDGGCDVVCC